MHRGSQYQSIMFHWLHASDLPVSCSAVQGLQAQLAKTGLSVPAAELTAERAARDACEKNLAQARTALMHRGQLIDELRKRVGTTQNL